MRRTGGVGSTLGWVGLALVLLGPLGGCSKSKPEKKTDRKLDHRAGIPVIPRGEVVIATAKGERYLLEIHAKVGLDQAVAFYRTQLTREHWSELRFQRVSTGLWGLAGRRGMFELAGRIKQLKQGVVSIGFERSVRHDSRSWTPPVHKDVPILGARVQWNDRVFQAPGDRVDLRGRSAHTPAVLRAALLADLKPAGWAIAPGQPAGTVKATRSLTRKVTAAKRKQVKRELQGSGWTVTADKDQQSLHATRELTYHFEAVGKGASVSLQLSYQELQSGKVPAQGKRSVPARTPPRPAPSSDLVPLPKDLALWPSSEKVLGVKQSDNLHMFSFTRKCTAPAKLLEKVVRRLRKLGWRGLGTPTLPMVSTGVSSMHSATVSKGKRVAVVIVTPDAPSCTVQLTVVRETGK